MDFSFLLRQGAQASVDRLPRRGAPAGRGCYDLLASEARLTSLFAIAKGDIRRSTGSGSAGRSCEIGFSRGADLLVGLDVRISDAAAGHEGAAGRHPQPDQPADRAQADPVRQRSKNVPWGISEAAYNARDHEMNYQYTNFGVPGLGLKRGLAQNTVIAPYATVLAAQYMPREAAVENLKRLRAIGALGATASTMRSTSRRRACRKADLAPWSTITWPPFTACRSWRSPTSSSKAACATASTPIRSSRRPNCCCRKRRRATSR
jgi:cyclic beta-1,2-glucan synthetase